MSKLFATIDNVIKWFIILSMALLVIVCMLAVLFRYTGSSLFWADEFMRYLFINVIFYGCPLLVYKKANIIVDITGMILSPAGQRKLSIINDLLFIAFGCYMAYISIPLVTMGVGQTSSAMEVEMAWIYLCMPIGFAMVAVNGLRLLSQDMKPATAMREGGSA